MCSTTSAGAKKRPLVLRAAQVPRNWIGVVAAHLECRRDACRHLFQSLWVSVLRNSLVLHAARVLSKQPVASVEAVQVDSVTVNVGSTDWTVSA